MTTVEQLNQILGAPKGFFQAKAGAIFMWKYPTPEQVETLNTVFGTFTKSLDREGRWYRKWQLPSVPGSPPVLWENHFNHTIATRWY